VRSKDSGECIFSTDVHWHKLLTEASKIHSEFDIPESEIARVKTAFEAVAGNYQREKCAKCKGTELNGSWTRLPIADMASQIDTTLRKLAFNAYLRPTFHIHTTHFGILDQCDKSADDKLRFSDAAKQRKMAADALTFAHIVLLQLMAAINCKFVLGKDDQLTRIGKEFESSWATVEGNPEPPQQNGPRTPSCD
jgi:hypothetical protein